MKGGITIIDGVVFAENMTSNIRMVRSALRACRSLVFMVGMNGLHGCLSHKEQEDKTKKHTHRERE